MFPWNKRFRSSTMDLDFTWAHLTGSFQNAAEVLIPCYSFSRVFITTAPTDQARIRFHHAGRQRAGKPWRTVVMDGAKSCRAAECTRKLLIYWKLLLKLLHNLHKSCCKVSFEWGMASDPVCFFLAQGTTHSRHTGCHPCEISILNFKTEK